MTMSDLLCDHCGAALIGPAAADGDAGDRLGIRFSYHPGNPDLADGTGLLCGPCWRGAVTWLGRPGPEPQCSRCDVSLDRSLYVKRVGNAPPWRLCTAHALEFLNRLRTVDPKLEPETFELPEPGP